MVLGSMHRYDEAIAAQKIVVAGNPKFTYAQFYLFTFFSSLKITRKRRKRLVQLRLKSARIQKSLPPLFAEWPSRVSEQKP